MNLDEEMMIIFFYLNIIKYFYIFWCGYDVLVKLYLKFCVRKLN